MAMGWRASTPRGRPENRVLLACAWPLALPAARQVARHTPTPTRTAWPPIETEIADRRFKEHLKRSRAGRILQAHLAGMRLRNEASPRDNSMQEAIDNERVFIKTMGMCLDRGMPFPCGLPTPLPKFIAILNLSGERMLVHSNSCSLIRLLCTRSTQISPSELATEVDSFATHPNISQEGKENPLTKFVLLSLSLPWQAGTSALFWSLSACSFNTNPNPRIVLDDRAITLTSHSPRAFVGKPVLDRTDHAIPLDDERDMPLVTSDQAKALSDDYACICLDPSSPGDGVADGALGGEGGDAQSRAREETLRRLIVALKEQATKDKERYDALQTEFDDATAANLGIISTTELQRREEAEKHAEALKTLRRERDALEEQIRSARSSATRCCASRRATKKRTPSCRSALSSSSGSRRARTRSPTRPARRRRCSSRRLRTSSRRRSARSRARSRTRRRSARRRSRSCRRSTTPSCSACRRGSRARSASSTS